MELIRKKGSAEQCGKSRCLQGAMFKFLGSGRWQKNLGAWWQIPGKLLLGYLLDRLGVDSQRHA